jgi:hypothetical protein
LCCARALDREKGAFGAARLDARRGRLAAAAVDFAVDPFATPLGPTTQSNAIELARARV